jgi:hypothetical protein
MLSAVNIASKKSLQHVCGRGSLISNNTPQGYARKRILKPGGYSFMRNVSGDNPLRQASHHIP